MPPSGAHARARIAATEPGSAGHPSRVATLLFARPESGTQREGPPDRRPLVTSPPASAGAEDHPLVGTSALTGIAFTVIVNGELAAPWLSGPPGSFTRTVSAPAWKNDCVML